MDSVKEFYKDKIYPLKKTIILTILAIMIGVWYGYYQNKRIENTEEKEKVRSEISVMSSQLEIRAKGIILLENKEEYNQAVSEFMIYQKEVQTEITALRAQLTDLETTTGNVLSLLFAAFFFLIGVISIPHAANWIQHLTGTIEFTKEQAYVVFAAAIIAATYLYVQIIIFVFGTLVT